MKYLFIVCAISIVIVLVLFSKSIERFEINEDETTCVYVSSHGIKKTIESVEKAHYIKSDNLNSFNIPLNPFILVTGDEDTTIPDDFKDKSNEILNSKNLIHWYTQNLNYTNHTKLKHLPIGLDYHTIANGNMSSWGSKESPKKQEEFIIKLVKKPFYDREVKLYINFNNSIRGKYGKEDRKDAINQTPKNLQVIEKENIPRKETWKNMSKYSFVLSPHGNGLDCHRTWESLVLGCIPVVKTSSLDILYEDLPVLIVNNWYDIDEELLKNTIIIFKNKEFNYDKLKLEYWINKIKDI